MSNNACPNCGGPEWLQGLACWDCGWEAVPDEKKHCWSESFNGKSRHERLGLQAPVCLQCGVVRRADHLNATCKGRTGVGARE